jgi:hypothetical protein
VSVVCVTGCETFDYLDNRIKCIDSLTGAGRLEGARNSDRVGSARRDAVGSARDSFAI